MHNNAGIIMVLNKQGKQEVVEKLKKKLKDSKVVAIASVQNLPTKHYNRIRKKVGENAEAFLTRSSLVRRAIDEGRPELKELEGYLQGSCAVVFSNISAFKLAKLLRESRSKTFAKAGQIAPSDIIVPAGETNLPPGPVLTELKQAKIEARIQGPKVVIMKDATVARKGEPISVMAANILTKLAIEPMEVGLKLRAAFEDGLVYKEDVLDIDDKFWLDSLVQAHQQALNLSVFAEIYNKYSIELLIQKASREEKALNAAIDAKAPKEEKEGKEPAKEEGNVEENKEEAKGNEGQKENEKEAEKEGEKVEEKKDEAKKEGDEQKEELKGGEKVGEKKAEEKEGIKPEGEKEKSGESGNKEDEKEAEKEKKEGVETENSSEEEKKDESGEKKEAEKVEEAKDEAKKEGDEKKEEDKKEEPKPEEKKEEAAKEGETADEEKD